MYVYVLTSSYRKEKELFGHQNSLKFQLEWAGLFLITRQGNTDLKSKACVARSTYKELWLSAGSASHTYSKHSHGRQGWIQLSIKFIIFSKRREQQTVAVSGLNTPRMCWPLIYWKKPAGKNILCCWLMSASVISFHLDSWPVLTSPPWRIQKNLKTDPRALLAWDLQNAVFAK